MLLAKQKLYGQTQKNMDGKQKFLTNFLFNIDLKVAKFVWKCMRHQQNYLTQETYLTKVWLVEELGYLLFLKKEAFGPS